MHFDSSNLIPVLPEIFMLTMVCLIIILDLFLEESQRQTTYLLSQVSLAVTIFLILLVSSSDTQVVFDGSYIRDPMSDGLKVCIVCMVCIVCIVCLVCIVYSA